MSVEKMTLLNIVGKAEDAENVLKDIVTNVEVDLIPAIHQIESNNFAFDVTNENIDKIIDMNYAGSYKKESLSDDLRNKSETIKRIFDIKDNELNIKIDTLFAKEDILKEFDNIIGEIHDTNEKINTLKKDFEHLEGYYSNIFRELKNFSISLSDLRSMEYFEFKVGILSKEGRQKVKKNYENILGIFLHTGSSQEGEVYIVMYPKEMIIEMTRILRSLGFKEIPIPEEYTGTPKEISEQIDIKRNTILAEIAENEKIEEKIKSKYGERVKELLAHAKLILKMEDIKENLAFSTKYFYFSAWIAESDKDKVTNLLKKYNGIVAVFKKDEISNAPTKLKNNWLFKPFEMLVKMYGTPSYNELDPTPFLSLSYMFLFGMMFGDLGQGFVILLAGLLVGKKSKTFGGLLTRLGASSMVFGTLYGAVFGFETIIPALLIRPFENINTMLLIAIGVGVTLLIISYILGIINAFKRKDVEEAIFGNKGIAGFVLFIDLLLLVGGMMLGLNIMPMPIGIAIAVLTLLSIIFKMPLANLVEKKRPLHHEDITGYYIEGVFSLLETFLSMLSGTVSFIRVGAFALTHVGLFIAFETIGEMIGSAAGNAVVLIIGNLLILGLEGLIVFIQGLRLQYYELFSRYYKGDGKAFEPVKLEY